MTDFRQNFSLKPYNSFGLDETAAFYCEAGRQSDLSEALDFAKTNFLKVLVIGGGSNILLTGPFPGLVIRINNSGISIAKKDNNHVWLEVAAGENWHQFVLYTLHSGFYGLENLSLIPGSVGAAPMQNIGAYGVEAGNFIESVTFFDSERNRFRTLTSGECGFSYRDSIFKQELKGIAIIWSVRFRLNLVPFVKSDYGDIQNVLAAKNIENPGPIDISDAVIQIRKAKLPDPAVTGNAGSFFKNPVVSQSDFEKIKIKFPNIPVYPSGENLVKVPAGWLIEAAGWKGKRVGNCGVHDRQALVLVNFGNAKGSEIWSLALEIQEDIESKFGIRLQPEVNLI